MSFEPIHVGRRLLVATGVVVALLSGNAAWAQSVTVLVSPQPGGTVSSSPGNIHCSISALDSCSDLFTIGSTVTLTATPDAGYKFTGWVGKYCSDGISRCTFTVDDMPDGVGALFAKGASDTETEGQVSVLVTPYPGGTVSSSPGSIRCSISALDSCSDLFTIGSTVTLTATPDAGYKFTGWVGKYCSDGISRCTFTVDDMPDGVAVSFARGTANPSPSRTLQVGYAGEGSITSVPAGIDCGARCSASLDSGTQVTLTAKPANGYRLTGWEGCSSVNGNTCTVTLDNHKKVDAIFREMMSICLWSTFSRDENRILDLYIAYYGRPAYAGGLSYWLDELNKAGGNMAAIIDRFANSDEYESRFGGMKEDELVRNLFQFIIGRPADDDGLNFYTHRLKTGEASLGTIALQILDGVKEGRDLAVLENRRQVAQHLAFKSKSSSFTLQADELSKILQAVTEDPGTIQNACNNL